MTKRYNLVEFARFMFSLLVIGFHVQMSFSDNAINLFENGSLAVEFFFLISGHFLARSIEKINAKENNNTTIETGRFMCNKVKGILTTHLTAITMIIAVVFTFDLCNAGAIILHGLPSIFLAQQFSVWNNAYASALIVPEWYLSAMLICMAIMTPIAISLRKKIRGELVILVLLGVLGVGVVIYSLCMNWAFTTTFVYDLRAWSEMCVGMFSYYLSAFLAKKELNRAGTVVLKIIEISGYSVPLILGIIPISSEWEPVCMAVTVIGVLFAITITFADKGVSITNLKLNCIFGYLGSISLAMYLFHPIVISIIDYAYIGVSGWAKYFTVFAATSVLAVLFNSIVSLIKIMNIKKPPTID